MNRSYEIKVAIEAGSPEDRVLRSVADPQEFIRSLVRGASSTNKTATPSRFTELDLQALAEADPSFAFFSGFSDDQIKQLEDSTRRVRKQRIQRSA